MASISLLTQAKELETQINGIMSSFDVTDLPAKQRELVAQLKHQLVDVRLDARDYEYAQTRAEQSQAAVAGRKRLAELHKGVLKASEHNMFGAVDTAQISARIEQLMSEME